MENQLPLCLKNVSYKSISTYSWKGDLVIVQGVIYFLPTRDLELERENAINKIPIGGMIGLVIQLGVTLLERRINDQVSKDKSYLTDRGLSSENITESNLRQWLEHHWKEIKEAGSLDSSLPRPVRFFAKDVKNVALKSTVLCLKTDADEYFFKFPRNYNEVLRNALFKAQFAV